MILRSVCKCDFIFSQQLDATYLTPKLQQARGEQFHTVSGSHCGRLFGERQAWWAHNLPKFNMADSVKKILSLACFRQLDCVFQYSYTSLSILQFHSQFFLLCFQPTAGCSL